MGVNVEDAINELIDIRFADMFEDMKPEDLIELRNRVDDMDQRLTDFFQLVNKIGESSDKSRGRGSRGGGVLSGGGAAGSGGGKKE